MPEWFPVLMNFGLATAIVVLLMFWGRDAVQAVWPSVQKRVDAKSSKIEEDAKTSAAVRDMLTGKEERDKAMSLALAEVAKDVGGLHSGVNRVIEILKIPCECADDRQRRLAGPTEQTA